MIYIIGCLIIIIGFLGIMLFRKQKFDTQERDKLKNEVHDLRNLR
jgi:preprotein translocase subunit YajC